VAGRQLLRDHGLSFHRTRSTSPYPGTSPLDGQRDLEERLALR
jgi:hypothetical protein